MLALSFLLEGGSSFEKKRFLKQRKLGHLMWRGVDRELAPAAEKGSCEYLSIL